MNHDLLLALACLVLLAALAYVSLKLRQTRKKYINTSGINNTLIEISNHISEYKDIDELYQKMLQYTIKLIKGAQYGSILVYDKIKDRMEFGALIGYDINAFTSRYLKKEEVFLYSLNKFSGPGIITNPLVNNKHFYKPYEHEILKNSKQFMYKSVLSAPLYIDGEFFGCISVDNIETTNAFTKNDMEIIKYITVHLEIVIKNMLLMNGMKERLITDSLTGLLNRRYYNHLVESDFTDKIPINATFIMIDMDNFKTVNDTYGHIKGDEVLKYFSDLLRSRFRKGDTIIRFAGDEFLLILNDCDEKDAERLLNEIKDELNFRPFQGINIEFSYGISRLNGETTPEEVVEVADMNMYMQKTAKKQAV